MIAQIFKAEEQRIVEALAKTDPSSETYDAILDRYEDLCRAALRGIDTAERIHYYLADLEAAKTEMQNPAPITPITPTPAEEKPEPAEDPEPNEPIDDHNPEITFEEVKARFVAAARSGFNVANVIAAAGYEKLSDVPSSEYAKLLDALSGVS